MANKNNFKKNLDTLIGKGVKMVGVIEFSGHLHIYGEVQGDIVAESGGHLHLGPEAKIQGTARAETMEIHGEVEGDIFCSSHLVFGSTSSCSGDVHYHNIQIDAGAQVSGRMIRAQDPLAIENAQKPQGQDKKEDADADL